MRFSTRAARRLRQVEIAFLLAAVPTAGYAGLISADLYPSVQQAIDANPGQMVFLPNGDYPLSAPLRIRHDGTGLYGPGRLVQQDPKSEIVSIDKAAGVRIKDITLTRAPGAEITRQAGLHADHCTGTEISGVHVIDNLSGAGSIRLTDTTNATVRDCTIQNYKIVTVEDRTYSARMGYAFKCIDGTGLVVMRSTGTQILNNRIVESKLLPTKETRDKYDLGAVTILPKIKGEQTPDDIFETKYTNNWHQGSGMVVTGGGMFHYTIISGNYIENAAQGMDIHQDNVIISNNIVTHAMMGMKAVHGAKHVIITGNQFDHVDLWGILLMPGSASHLAEAATSTTAASGENIAGGHVVSNNIISNFGYGEQYWNWIDKPGEQHLNAIAILTGPLKANPPVRDILVTGNLVYNDGADGVVTNGTVQKEPPRYRYALYVEQLKEPKPVDVRVLDNLLVAGRNGISNIPLP